MYVEGKPGVFECIHVRLQITFFTVKKMTSKFFFKNLPIYLHISDKSHIFAFEKSLRLIASLFYCIINFKF